MSPQDASAKRSRGGASTGQKSASRSTRSKPTSSNGRGSNQQPSRSKRNNTADAVQEKAGQAAEAGRNAAKPVAVSVATTALAAAAGVVGGVVLGRTKLTRKRKLLGVPVPGTGKGLDGLTRQVGEAGKQVGKLATEVKEAREKAERVAKALN